jgi:hypothetical protein
MSYSSRLLQTLAGLAVLAATGAHAQSEAGAENFSLGPGALGIISKGSQNTATGFSAAASLSTGSYDTAFGAYALNADTGGSNSALGAWALASNTTGVFNTAVGLETLYGNLGGAGNTAVGYGAMYTGTSGSYNAALGYLALGANTSSAALTGSYNVGLGYASLFNATSASRNIGIGFQAGMNIVAGSDNIDIGNPGGSAAENGAIRIGARGAQTSAFIQGISTTAVTGAAVYVTSSGQLGVLKSSERYKTDVAAMGGASGRLEDLRPVTFKYRDDEQGATQYGLIAEEVARIYPDLVVRDAQGRIDGVRYEELAPMLLNELQKQRKALAAQAQELAELKRQVAALAAGGR